MELTTADQYYLKASCSYPFDLESTIENLNYALSYDYEHASTHTNTIVFLEFGKENMIALQ